MERVEALRTLGEYAAGQWGMVTTAQAGQLGVDRVTVLRLIDAGLLETLTRGVHRLVGTGGDQHEQVRAQWLRLDMQTPAWERLTADTAVAVVSHRSAAVLHELGDIPEPAIEFTAPTRRRSRVDEVEFHVGPITAPDMTLVDGLPVTTPLRTVADLAADGVDGGHLGGVCEDVLDRGLGSRADLAAALEVGVRKYGMRSGDGPKLLEHLLEQAQSKTSLSATTAALEPVLAEAMRPIAQAIAEQLQLKLQLPPMITSHDLQIALAAAQEPLLRTIRDAQGLTTPLIPGMPEAIGHLRTQPELAEAIRAIAARMTVETSSSPKTLRTPPDPAVDQHTGTSQ